jgi:delta-aminolevulinic acid dehydratase/porphobilinogen synthase
MGIDYMVFSSMKQILDDVHDADVSVVTLFRKQRSHPFGPFRPALAHQMYPGRTQFFLEAFSRATARSHGCMVIDMKQNTPDILRLRTFIFPGEKQKA